MRTTAIINQKGGVGKTTTAHCLGCALSSLGKTVLYVDTDAQRNLTRSLGILEPDSGTMDVLVNGEHPDNVIQRTDWGDVIPATPALMAVATEIKGSDQNVRLKEALQKISDKYDYCIIDTPPTIGILTINALTASNDIVIPTESDIFSIEGISGINELVAQVQKITNPNLIIDGILITRYHQKTTAENEMSGSLEKVAAMIGTKVYQTRIRENITIKEAHALRTNLFEYAPRSNSAKDYNEFVKEYLERG